MGPDVLFRPLGTLHALTQMQANHSYNNIETFKSLGNASSAEAREFVSAGNVA